MSSQLLDIADMLPGDLVPLGLAQLHRDRRLAPLLTVPVWP